MKRKSSIDIINRLREYISESHIETANCPTPPRKNLRSTPSSCSYKEYRPSRTISEFIRRNHDEVGTDEKLEKLKAAAGELGVEYTFTPVLVA